MNAVIPAPAVPTKTPGGSLPVGGPWHVRADPPLLTTAATVRDLLTPHLGDRLLPVDDQGDGLVLQLTHDDAPPRPRRTHGVCPTGEMEPQDESYELTVDTAGITCRARTAAGAFRAAMSAAQLLLTTAPQGTISHQVMGDAPHFAWRGLMLDPARTFLSGDEIRRLIDAAALYKLNVLHLHLTDNEGWRLEIPSLPALTRPADGAAPAHYTAAEYEALQEYAALRHITLIPEIDLPGHCAALRQALPDLPDAPAPDSLPAQVSFTSPLDLTEPRTHTAVSTLLADVCALTRGPYVHIGGDEVLGMTQEGFASSVRQARDLVRKFGKVPLAWQEASRAGVEDGEVLQHWVDTQMMDLPETAADLAARPRLEAAGFTLEFAHALKRFFAPSDDDLARIVAGGGHVLLSPQSHLYLDRPYSSDITPPDCPSDTAALGFPSYRPQSVRHTAAWDPSSHPVPEEQIAGVEATLFAERLRGIDDVTTLLLPRLPSVAETAWTGTAPDWAEYRQRLGLHASWWQQRGLRHFPATDVPWQ
ncbi:MULTISPECIES: family 20 glycosylhydrolase [unclassified Streptomyces]|uniref:family 20 glycosylhydrolase n=1 Tax=unclassified Streptomyces TaxID=2593676 RepID=UPI002E189F65|nr:MULTISPECIES: family 20 glycosylhydrolase [unclassified Streptomyces]